MRLNNAFFIMKSTHNKSTQQDVKYPCLMVTKEGKVVLFESGGCGTVVVSICKSHPLGYFANNWTMSYFIQLPQNESVTLQND